MASGICLASGGGRCCYQPPSSCYRPPLNPSPPERWLPNFHPWLRQGRAGPVTGDWPGSDLSPSSKSLSRFNLLVYLSLLKVEDDQKGPAPCRRRWFRRVANGSQWRHKTNVQRHFLY
ncbi:hypothetical protein HanXRQr2_Chr05g0231871 [Helianthus annuus]|uniref:Uncharacterized protein n=1 Tax=Helianthus annuus TaxID=4232 RepID=A0A9K3J2Q0_HELAN|nr:hypothetical protein HanXRQr2_Chr05g0231871 [Helianthus annuus]